MRKKILALVFAAGLLMAVAAPMFGTGTAQGFNHANIPPDECAAAAAAGNAANNPTAFNAITVTAGLGVPVSPASADTPAACGG